MQRLLNEDLKKREKEMNDLDNELSKSENLLLLLILHVQYEHCRSTNYIRMSMFKFRNYNVSPSHSQAPLILMKFQVQALYGHIICESLVSIIISLILNQCESSLCKWKLSSDWDWDLGLGTWDLRLGTWDLGPGNRIENQESKLCPVPVLTVKSHRPPTATTTTTP